MNVHSVLLGVLALGGWWLAFQSAGTVLFWPALLVGCCLFFAAGVEWREDGR